MPIKSRLIISLLATLTIGCTMPLQPNADPITSSTQGSTLARMATVIAVDSVLIADDAQAPAAEAIEITGNEGVLQNGQRSRTVTELLLRFDDGVSARYRIAPVIIFQSGERVKVMTRGGHTSISR
ncbi:MAG: hypothetical protein ABIO19_17310 [Burkholderiaceae bacterium]